MSSPFSIKVAHLIFKGHFRTSPLGLVEKPRKPSALRLICHHSKCDHNGESTNGWLDSDDFPTRWYSAADCADVVSPFIFLAPCSQPLLQVVLTLWHAMATALCVQQPPPVLPWQMLPTAFCPLWHSQARVGDEMVACLAPVIWAVVPQLWAVVPPVLGHGAHIVGYSASVIQCQRP